MSVLMRKRVKNSLLQRGFTFRYVKRGSLFKPLRRLFPNRSVRQMVDHQSAANNQADC
jgi:hypothetical protein